MFRNGSLNNEKIDFRIRILIEIKIKQKKTMCCYSLNTTSQNYFNLNQDKDFSVVSANSAF